MSKETGGTAFPVPRHPNGGPVENGMTLRDYFAAKAMAAMVTANNYSGTTSEMVRNSYYIADVMLKERNK